MTCELIVDGFDVHIMHVTSLMVAQWGWVYFSVDVLFFFSSDHTLVMRGHVRLNSGAWGRIHGSVFGNSLFLSFFGDVKKRNYSSYEETVLVKYDEEPPQ